MGKADRQAVRPSDCPSPAPPGVGPVGAQSLQLPLPASLSPPGVSFNSVYTQIWRVLLHLAADPFPEVSDLAMKVLNSIAYKVGAEAGGGR